MADAAALLPQGWPPFTAVFTGYGLWTLWPVPYSANLNNWSTYHHWRFFEEDLTANVNSDFELAPRVVYSTVHSICDAGYFGALKKILDSLRGPDRDKALFDCASLLKQSLHPNLDLASRFFFGGKADSYNIQVLRSLEKSCRDGFIERANALLLRQRLLGHLALDRRFNSTLHVIDAFALTDGQCKRNLPGDSVHFHGMLFEELSLFFDAVG
jgi:hypothetical protein